MSLLGKIRTLVGALVHAPFAPRPEKDRRDEAGPDAVAARDRSDLESRPRETVDDERVADLIARRRRD